MPATADRSASGLQRIILVSGTSSDAPCLRRATLAWWPSALPCLGGFCFADPLECTLTLVAGMNAVNAASAFRFARSAFMKSAGAVGGGLGAALFRRGTFTPSSFSAAASRTSAPSCFNPGKSSTETMRPNCPIASSDFVPGPLALSRDAFQKPNPQCALNDANTAEHALVDEMRSAPLHRFFDIRTARVHRLADVRQDGPREGGPTWRCTLSRADPLRPIVSSSYRSEAFMSASSARSSCCGVAGFAMNDVNPAASADC